MIRFQIGLDEKAFLALRILAERDFRDFRQEAGLLICKSLESRGLLTQDTQRLVPATENIGVAEVVNEPAQ